MLIRCSVNIAFSVGAMILSTGHLHAQASGPQAAGSSGSSGYSGYGQGPYGGYGGPSPAYTGGYGGTYGGTYGGINSQGFNTPNGPSYYGFGNGPYGYGGPPAGPGYNGYGLTPNGYNTGGARPYGRNGDNNGFSNNQGMFYSPYGYEKPWSNNGFGHTGDQYFTKGSPYSRF